MTLALPRQRFPEMEQPVCAWCRCFPCICRREEPCVCGGSVAAREGEVLLAIRAHNASPEHAAWRGRNGL